LHEKRDESRDTERAMSEKNVKAIRELVAAFRQRDEDAWLALCDRRVELLDELTLNPNIYRGHDQIAAWFRGWEKAWTDMKFSGPEVIHAAGDLVVWRSHAQARGRKSGAGVAQHFWHVTRFNGDLIVRVENYRDEADALKAAGLSE
jgi:ketosteroid isomerase-like protein